METITNTLLGLLSVDGGGVTVLQALLAIAVAYLGGVVSSLTPCVYPMIPITVSVIGQSGARWREVALRGAAYVGGMALIYSILGVLAGLTGKVFGSLTNTPGWYVGLGLLMTAAALIMMDVVPFDPLLVWERVRRRLGFGRNKAHRHPSAQERSELSFLEAFSLGAGSGFIAAPCTTPVLASILGYIAKTQSVGLGLALMLAFSLGLGTLLLLIAAFT
ncbi:MAG: sulfite exporter TauE/SafE family protein, partial [Oligoflexia bacterium]|nr:sulfite exporter TauE/SafE family protein [Oligoflexia bacterium]